MKYSFNWELYGQLPTLLGTNKEHIYDKIGMSRASFLWSREHKDCKLGNLVKLCNAYRMHIDIFFKPGIPNKLVDNSEDWIPYKWHPTNIRTLWASRENPIVQRAEVMRFIGIQPIIGNSTMLRLTSEGSALRAQMWCDICNQYGIDYMLPFVDKEEIPNHLVQKNKPYTMSDSNTLSVAED